jgi:hypothetical protein
MAPRRRRSRFSESTWILAADPPLCRGGNPAAVLAACPRGDACVCTIDLGALAEDLAEVNRQELIEDWEVGVAAEVVADAAEALAAVGDDVDDDAAERLERWAGRLGAIASNGSSLASIEEFE